MISISSTSCCGMREIHDLGGSAKNMVVDIADHFIDDVCAFYIFSDVSYSSSGRTLAKYIKEHKLGTVYSTTYKLNPNSNNKLKVFVWSVNAKKLRTYAKDY